MFGYYIYLAGYSLENAATLWMDLDNMAASPQPSLYFSPTSLQGRLGFLSWRLPLHTMVLDLLLEMWVSTHVDQMVNEHLGITFIIPPARRPWSLYPPRSLYLPCPLTVRGARVEEGSGRLIHTLPCHPRLSDTGLTLSLLSSVLWWERGCSRREEITNLWRLHFPAPLLAGSQPGLVFGERLREGGKEKSRYLPPLPLRAVSLEWMHPLHCSVLVGPSLFSWLQLVPCVPNPGTWLPKVVFLA